MSIRTDTDYPFRGGVAMEVRVSEPVSFPLYLRIPRWCTEFGVSLNGRALDVATRPSAYLRIERAWTSGDRISGRR